MPERVLLCTDLDRTLLPNGTQPESPRARARFRALAERPEVTLAYVTGRHRRLVDSAIAAYKLPVCAYAVTDVGTRILERAGSEWRAWPGWEDEIAMDWAGLGHAELAQELRDVPALRLQEVARQGAYKLSYYVPLQADREALLAAVRSRLEERGVCAALVWSLDDPSGVGLLDVVPARATKLHAIEFLRLRLGFACAETVFAGDSGNDLEVLASGLPAVLVRNARPEVRDAALGLADAAGTRMKLYLATGGFCGMNGNYGAGILEGLAHFLPHTKRWWCESADE